MTPEEEAALDSVVSDARAQLKEAMAVEDEAIERMRLAWSAVKESDLYKAYEAASEVARTSHATTLKAFANEAFRTHWREEMKKSR